MLQILPAIIIIVAVIAAWTVFTQRKLVMLDENISNAMSLIGAQMSSRFDVLMFLLELAKGYAVTGCEELMETVRAERGVIMAKSAPDDVIQQEGVISDVFGKIVIASDRNPKLTADPNYIKAMDAMRTIENMMHTSRLIYNDSAARLNREIRMFPASVLARILGLRQWDYLAE